jgi:hypothetical protein
MSDEPQELTQKQKLMERCRLLGITFSNNSTEETLAAKIDAKLNEPDPSGDEPDAGGDTNDSVTSRLSSEGLSGEEINALTGAKEEDELTEDELAKLPKLKRDIYIRQRQMKEQMKLLRVRIANLNPEKNDLPGEIFTVANEYVGTVRKLIPYDEAGEAYHIPYILYTFLKEKKFLQINTKTGRRQGAFTTEQVTSRYVPEFSIEVLPPLTKAELAALAKAQIAAGTITVGDDGFNS